MPSNNSETPERTSKWPDAPDVHGQLDRILGSNLFRTAKRERDFLQFVIVLTLAGKADQVKETVIGIEVFRRPSSLDAEDSIVRSTARRLRARLEKYYATEGQQDPVLICVPAGSYVPQFTWRECPAQLSPVHFISERTPLSKDAPEPAGGVYYRWKMLALLCGIVLLSIVLGGLWMRRGSTRSPARQSVGVLRIRDLSKAPTEVWLQTALPEMLTSELNAGGKLRTVPAEDVSRWRTDLGKGADNGSQADLLRSAEKNLGADTFVLGSYVVTGTCPNCRVRVDLGLLKARTSEQIGTIIEEGTDTELLDLTARLGRRLRSELGLQADAPAAPRWPAASAMREYAQGLENLRRMDPMTARDHLQAAVAGDPFNALIHSALADAWTALGYVARANEEDKRAYELAGSLDRLDRLGIEARYRASLQQWDRAIEIYKTIFQLFPDSLDDGINLALAQLRAWKSADLSATLNALHKLPAPDGNDPRIDLLAARTAGILTDYSRTRDLARRAAEEAKARGARYVFARSRLLESGALANLNDPQWPAVRAEARQVCQDIGDRECLSQVWRVDGNFRYYTGDFEAAQQAYLQGIAITRELGNRRELSNLLDGLGAVAQANRDWKEAERNLMEAISVKVETGYDPSEVRNNLAELYLRMGRLSEAEHVLADSAAATQAIGAHEELGDIFRLQAALARARGDLRQAENLGENAVAELRRSKNPLSLSLALAGLSSVHSAVGDLAAAERDLKEAIPPQDVLVGQGAVQLAQAQLSIAKGQFAAAGQAAAKAAAAFDRAHLDGQSAIALVTAADALEMSHRDADAVAACREGELRAARTPDQFPIAVARLCTWRFSADTGSLRDLQTLVAQAHNPEVQLIADYSRAVRAKRAGDRNYRVLSDTVSTAAGTLGYGTLSRRAASL